MFLKYTFYFIGIILTSTSLFFIIVYLNLINMGYSFLEYVNFIIRRIECINLIFGILFMFLSLKKRKEKKNDIYIRRFRKF